MAVHRKIKLPSWLAGAAWQVADSRLAPRAAWVGEEIAAAIEGLKSDPLRISELPRLSEVKRFDTPLKVPIETYAQISSVSPEPNTAISAIAYALLVRAFGIPIRVNYRIPRKLARAVEEKARARGRDVDQFVLDALAAKCREGP